jgi:hypothetical protein
VTWLRTVGAALAAGVVFFFLGRWTAPVPAPAPGVVVRDTIPGPVVHDTIPRIVYRHLPAVIETVDVDGTQGEVAAAQVIVESPGGYQDSVQVLYFYPPLNEFDVSLGLAPRRRETELVVVTEYVPVPCPERSWTERFNIGPGVAAVYDAGKVHIAPGIGVYFGILP